MTENAVIRNENQIQEEILSMAMEIISIESETSNFSGGIEKCQKKVIEIASQLGFITSVHGKGKVIIIEHKRNKETIGKRAKLGIVMHVDTVPLDASKWTHNPLGEISDGYLYGRGVIDDKGPIAIALEVMKSFEEDEILPLWQIIVGDSEESANWTDMKYLLEESNDPDKEYVLPEFLITVDGDGVKLGTRGYADLVLTFEGLFSRKKADTLLIRRDSIKNFILSNPANNVVPSQLVLLTDLGKKIISYGISVHSSIPEQGRSAICSMAHMLKETYRDYYYEFSKAFELLILVDSDPHGKVFFGSEENVSVKSSISATNISFDNESRKMTLNLNLRLGTNVTMELLEYLRNDLKILYGASKAEFYGETYLASSIKSNMPEVKAMEEAYFEVMGTHPDLGIERGIGYNAALPNCAIFGPRFEDGDDDDIDLCHMPDERRSIRNIMLFYEMLKSFVQKVLKS